MKQFISFVKKEFIHIFRDRRTMLILLGMPVVQILLFGFAINMDVQNIRTAVYDPSQDEATRHITEQIIANPYFDFKGRVASMSEIEDMMVKGAIDIAVVFEDNFHTNMQHTGKSQVQVIADTSDPNSGTISASYVSAIIAEYQMQLLGINQIPYHIDVETKLLYNPEMRSTYTFVPGVMGLVLLIICTLMTSISIVREKERGTMEVLLASPLKPTTVLLSKTIPYLTLSFVNLVSILLLAVYVLNVPIKGSLMLLLGISTLFIFLSLSLGLLISTLVDKQITAILISGIGMIMPVLILSGMIFPIANMPNILQWASSIVPSKWYISAVKKVMIEGLGFASVIKEVSILLIMSIGLITVSIRNIKTRLE